MKYLIYAMTIVVLIGAPSSGWAQRSGSASSSDTVPKALMPPAGLCRVWLSGVPAERQPAPIECAAAVRNVPPNARVIFGDTAATRARSGGTQQSTGQKTALPDPKVVPLPNTLPPLPNRVIPPVRDTLQQRSSG